MRKLSDGSDSTLGRYKLYARALFGEDSEAVTFLAKKVREAPGGEEEEVIADEAQMLQLLASIDRNGKAGG